MKIKKILLPVLLIICLIILAGCKSIDYGIVIQKSFVKAHRAYRPLAMYANGRTSIYPRWVNYPDQWEILVENEDGRDWWNVSEGYYNSVEIGDQVDRRQEETK